MSNKKICIGFKLLKEYPGCHMKVGDFEPLTTGLYHNYPEFWEPIYHDTPNIVIGGEAIEFHENGISCFGGRIKINKQTFHKLSEAFSAIHIMTENDCSFQNASVFSIQISVVPFSVHHIHEISKYFLEVQKKAKGAYTI